MGRIALGAGKGELGVRVVKNGQFFFPLRASLDLLRIVLAPAPRGWWGKSYKGGFFFFAWMNNAKKKNSVAFIGGGGPGVKYVESPYLFGRRKKKK